MEVSFWLRKPPQYETSSSAKPADWHSSASIDFEYPLLTCDPSSTFGNGPFSPDDDEMALNNACGVVSSNRPPGLRHAAMSLISLLSSRMCSTLSKQIATSCLASRSALL